MWLANGSRISYNIRLSVISYQLDFIKIIRNVLVFISNYSSHFCYGLQIFLVSHFTLGFHKKNGSHHIIFYNINILPLIPPLKVKFGKMATMGGVLCVGKKRHPHNVLINVLWSKFFNYLMPTIQMKYNCPVY